MFLTVRDMIERVFPRGTSLKVDDNTGPFAGDITGINIQSAPFWPPDLFAVCAHMLQSASAYHRIVEVRDGRAADADCLPIRPADIRMFRRIAQQWSLDPVVPEKVNAIWAKLVASGGRPICDFQQTASKPAAWWKHAFALMAIADETCADVGYEPPPNADWDRKWVVKVANRYLKGSAPSYPKSRHLRHSQHNPSITSALVDQDVVCVQPKARTPDVGCSLRNLSHNVALLPARGVMRVHWLTPPAVQSSEDSASLNLLLVPFPYGVSVADFTSDVVVSTCATAPWGWFDLHQGWLNGGAQSVIDLTRALLRQAEAHEQVHGIVFPEFALTYDIYEKLAEYLRDNHPSLQFLVSGSNSNCGGEVGNYALASHFFGEASENEKGQPSRMMATVSRAKHHRWSLEASQIEAYDLSGSFPTPLADMRWWEQIPLRPREVHVNAMRSASVFSVMICEDLARSDPAHEPLRAIGPNLVFVLLMDGPQLEWRWSARYSTGLAEDPGTSVLTLTSRALVSRWNGKKAEADRSWSIGLWKDEANRAQEIVCAPGSEGVLLKLLGKRQVEKTLDGRDNTQTYAWHRLGASVPVSLDRTGDAELIARLGL